VERKAARGKGGKKSTKIQRCWLFCNFSRTPLKRKSGEKKHKHKKVRRKAGSPVIWETVPTPGSPNVGDASQGGGGSYRQTLPQTIRIPEIKIPYRRTILLF